MSLSEKVIVGVADLCWLLSDAVEEEVAQVVIERDALILIDKVVEDVDVAPVLETSTLRDGVADSDAEELIDVDIDKLEVLLALRDEEIVEVSVTFFVASDKLSVVLLEAVGVSVLVKVVLRECD